MTKNIYTKGLSVYGGLGISYSFISEESRNNFIRDYIPKLEIKYGLLKTSLFDLPGLKVGDTCRVSGEGSEEFKIIGIKMYSKNRPGFILDSGWCEEIVKCF